MEGKRKKESTKEKRKNHKKKESVTPQKNAELSLELLIAISVILTFVKSSKIFFNLILLNTQIKEYLTGKFCTLLKKRYQCEFVKKRPF